MVCAPPRHRRRAPSPACGEDCTACLRAPAPPRAGEAKRTHGQSLWDSYAVALPGRAWPRPQPPSGDWHGITTCL